MNTIQIVAIIASVLTIVSGCVNVIQWSQRAELIKALRARSQAAYNYFFNIARQADTIRELETSNPDEPIAERLQIAITHAHRITGCVDTARNDIISYSREHLNFIPLEEHPARPILSRLPQPRRSVIGKIMQIPSRIRTPDMKKVEHGIGQAAKPVRRSLEEEKEEKST